MFRFIRALPARTRMILTVLVLLIAALAFLADFSGTPPSGPAGSPGVAQPADPNSVSLARLPPEVAQTLQRIKRGGPFPYSRDGVTFGNREGRLPKQKRGYYTEYTVPTPGSSSRGSRRIVAGQGSTGDPATSGEYWYTGDHYKTFRRIREK